MQLDDPPLELHPAAHDLLQHTTCQVHGDAVAVPLDQLRRRQESGARVVHDAAEARTLTTGQEATSCRDLAVRDRGQYVQITILRRERRADVLVELVGERLLRRVPAFQFYMYTCIRKTMLAFVCSSSC